MGQGCATKKIEASPVMWSCKTQGARHIISMKNMRFSSHPRAKVRQQRPPGSARGLPWWEFNIWNDPVWSFSLWISLGNTHALYCIQHPSFKWVQIQSNKAKSEKGIGNICSQIKPEQSPKETKEILNKTRTNFALKQKQILLSFLVIIIFGVMCLWGVGNYMRILKEATTIISKPPTLKARRYMYMCIVLHLDKNVQMYW